MTLAVDVACFEIYCAAELFEFVRAKDRIFRTRSLDVGPAGVG